MSTKRKKPAKVVAVAPKNLFCVMEAYDWSAVKVNGISLTAPKDGPFRLIPVFETFEQAVAFNGGSEERVAELVRYTHEKP